MKFFAFEFWGSRETTTGDPNPKTGRLGIAGYTAVFSTRERRDAWVEAGRTTSAMRGCCREAVTLKELRRLCFGMSVNDFNEHIAILGVDDEA